MAAPSTTGRTGGRLPDGTVLPLWQAAKRYREAGIPVVIVAGERYGMGSSRDWAAKGAALLGTRAVDRVEIDLIHEPAWSAEMMSGDVKQAFGW